MTDTPAPDESDFHSAMQGVERLSSDRADLRSPPTRRKPDQNQRYRRAAAQQEIEGFVDGLSTSAVDIVESEQDLLFANPGVQIRLLKRLRQGHVPWQAGLDLHGFSIDQARDELARFIRDSTNNNLRCVLVVHGKSFSQPGQPALIKSYVNDWLRQLPAILAFCSAQPADGGTGALYVLLRRHTRAD